VALPFGGSSSLLEDESESEESDAEEEDDEEEDEEDEEEEEEEEEEEDSFFAFLAGGAATLAEVLETGATFFTGSGVFLVDTALPLEGGGASLELLLESESSLLDSSEEDSTFLAGFLATSLDFAIKISFHSCVTFLL
jgi:hypothetical protein